MHYAGYLVQHEISLEEGTLMKRPNRHFIALINYFALVPLVYFIPEWVIPYLVVNKFLQVCVVVAIIVPIISYIVIPITMRLFDKQTETDKEHIIE